VRACEKDREYYENANSPDNFLMLLENKIFLGLPRSLLLSRQKKMKCYTCAFEDFTKSSKSRSCFLFQVETILVARA